MSKSANIVALSLLNKYYIRVKLGYVRFRVYQPFINDLVRAFAGDKVDLGIDGQQRYSIKTLARLLFRREWQQKLFTWYAYRYATCEQIRAATINIADVVTGKDLLQAVKVDKTKKKTISETIGNNTITGIMGSMMEHLNLTYQEAFYEINYPTMLLMMIDKSRTLMGDEQKIIKGSGKEMGARRGAAKRRK